MKTGRPFMILAGMASVLGLALAGVGRGQMRIGEAGESLRLSLLRLSPVQKELKLSEEQLRKIGEFGEELKQSKKKLEAARKEKAKPKGAEPVGEIQPDQEKAALEGSLADLEQEGDKELSKLLGARQRARLNQIAWQLEGAWAFLDPQVIRAVRLDDGQIEGIRELLGDVRQAEDRQKADEKVAKEARKDLVGDFAIDAVRKEQEKGLSRTHALKASKQATATILRNLTKKQREAYQRTIGEPFDFGGLKDPKGSPLFVDTVDVGLGLLRYPAVQEEIRLADEQKDALAQGKPAAKVLDGRQRARLEQLGLQGEGPTAFTRPDLIRSLRLTDAQVEEIGAILNGLRDGTRELRESLRAAPGPVDEPVDPDLEKARKAQAKQELRARSSRSNGQVTRRIEALLTRPQREAFRARLGEPFDFSRLRESASSTKKGGPDR